jgi:hypothetical protein
LSVVTVVLASPLPAVVVVETVPLPVVTVDDPS